MVVVVVEEWVALGGWRERVGREGAKTALGRDRARPLARTAQALIRTFSRLASRRRGVQASSKPGSLTCAWPRWPAGCSSSTACDGLLDLLAAAATASCHPAMHQQLQPPIAQHHHRRRASMHGSASSRGGQHSARLWVMLFIYATLEPRAAGVGQRSSGPATPADECWLRVGLGKPCSFIEWPGAVGGWRGACEHPSTAPPPPVLAPPPPAPGRPLLPATTAPTNGIAGRAGQDNGGQQRCVGGRGHRALARATP